MAEPERPECQDRVFWAMVTIGLGGLVVLTNPPFWRLFGDVRYDWFPLIGA